MSLLLRLRPARQRRASVRPAITSPEGLAEAVTTGLLLALVAVVLALVVATRLAPTVGREAFIIGSSSMVPALPLGSLAIVDRQAEIAPGDIVSFRTTGGLVITHRVVRVLDADGNRSFETKGDANEAADSAPVPESALIGRVELAIPVAGYVLAVLGTPSGIVAVGSLAAALITLGWMLGEQPPAAHAGRSPRSSSVSETRSL